MEGKKWGAGYVILLTTSMKSSLILRVAIMSLFSPVDGLDKILKVMKEDVLTLAKTYFSFCLYKTIGDANRSRFFFISTRYNKRVYPVTL